MATANLDVDGLSNSQVDDVAELVEKFLQEKYEDKEIQVVLYDSDLDPKDDGEK